MHFGTVVLNETLVQHKFDASATLGHCNLVYELLVHNNATNSLETYTGSDVVLAVPEIQVKSKDESLDLLTYEYTLRVKAERN